MGMGDHSSGPRRAFLWWFCTRTPTYKVGAHTQLACYTYKAGFKALKANLETRGAQYMIIHIDVYAWKTSRISIALKAILANLSATGIFCILWAYSLLRLSLIGLSFPRIVCSFVSPLECWNFTRVGSSLAFTQCQGHYCRIKGNQRKPKETKGNQGKPKETTGKP